ncbi:MAG: copper resistance protein CopC [Frankia sp.]
MTGPPVTGRRVTGRRVLIVAGLAIAAVLGLAGPASAHAVLEQTTPEGGGTVTAAPRQVVLDFDESVGIDTGSVQVLNAAGQRADDGVTRHGRSGALVVVGLRPGLARGTYVVSWRATSADSHPVAGAFTFGVGVRPDVTAATRIGHRSGSVAVGWADGIARFTAELGLVLALGGGAFLVGLWPVGLRRRGPALLLAAGGGLTIAAAVALIVLEGPYGAGLGLTAAGRWSLLSRTLHTRYGQLALLRILLVALAVPLPRLVAAANVTATATAGVASAAARRARWARAALAVLAVAAAATIANAGHAGTGGGTALATTSLTLHVTAVCVWLGGLAVLGGFLLRRDDAPVLARLMPRWSRTAMASAAVVAVTGFYQAWREIGPLGALAGTAYGQVVLLKVVLFVAMLGCGWLAHRWVIRRGRMVGGEVGGGQPATGRPGPKPRPGDHLVHLAFRTDVGLLRRLVAVEAAVGAAVLVVTAVLVNEQPGRTSYAPTIARTVTVGPLIAQIDISPTRRGPETVHVYVFDQQGRPQTVQQVTGQISLPGRGVGPLAVPFIAGGPAHAIADALDVPFPGEWQLAVTIRVGDFDQYSTLVTYRVR